MMNEQKVGRSATRSLPLLFAALLLTCLAGFQFKAHCTTDGAWDNVEEYTTGCYSDAIPFWTERGLAAGLIPYVEAPLEYPVLMGALIWAEGKATHLLAGPEASAVAFLLVVTLGNMLLAAILLVMLHRAGMPGVRLWGWAVAPGLFLYVGHNWDLLAIILTVAALLLARRDRPVAAAALTGLGVAAKLYPILLLPLLGLGALTRSSRSWPQRIGDAALIGGAGVGAWLLVNAPVAWAAFDNWAQFYRFSGARDGTVASLWSIAIEQGWIAPDNAALNLTASLSFVVGAAVILLAGWRRHHAHLWVLFTPMLAWFMLTNKVYSPQFDLWLWPVLLMTSRRWQPVALFALAGVIVYFAEMWWIAGVRGADQYATAAQVAVAAALRAAALLWIIVDAVRSDAPEWLIPTGASAPR